MKNLLVAMLVFATAISFSRIAIVSTQLTPVVYATGNTGAIWTTTSNCQTVNGNIFSTKQSVHLNGGPNGNGNGNNGFEDGFYFVKVTEPDGTLLGHVSDGVTVHVTNGSLDSCYNLYALTTFADTTNNGGEYKVWISKDINFSGGTFKTDNFKVLSEDVGPSVSPSASPSSEPSSEPSASPSIEPSASPSIEPSTSPTSTPASTDNNNGGSGDGLSDGRSSCPECTQAPNSNGQVLGASTFAKTGVVEDVIMNALGSLGSLMTVMGSVLYGKKKTKHSR